MHEQKKQWCFAIILSVATASHVVLAGRFGQAAWGTEPMKVSQTGPQNLLPSFFFMSGAEEGGAYSPPPGGYKGGLGTPRPYDPPDTCPDEIFDGTMQDLRVPVLPYLEQDKWGCERTPSNEKVLVLENDYLRAAITNQWGGKIWSLYNKKEKKQMFFNNPAHQPANIGYRKAWTSGGAEWNWAPGYIGHSVFTESPVYTAKLHTAEYGDIVRVWEYDRLNNTVWSVDIGLVDDVLFSHVTITNPNDVDLKGYWWTCVAMRVTPLTRVVTPATMDISPCVSWPYGAWTLANTTFTGPDIDGCAGASGSPDHHCAWQQDMSYLGNIPRPHDYFFHRWRPQKKFPLPYVTWVDETGFSVVHMHGKGDDPNFMNGTKFFTWGEGEFGKFQQDFLSASDYTNPKCEQDPGGVFNYYDPWCTAYEHEGDYTELQIGPAHSQMHTFPVPRNKTVSWTEAFKAWQADPTAMHERNYYSTTGPVAEVETFLASSDGVPFEQFKTLDQFFEDLSRRTPNATEVIAPGTPWGALAEYAFNTTLAVGNPFLLAMNESVLLGRPDTRPWVELIKFGSFSNATLNAVPQSFMIDPFWVKRIEQSAKSSTATWLHDLYLGTAALERGDRDAAQSYFQSSMSKKASVHAARNLALIAPDLQSQVAYYLQSWELWKALQMRDSADSAVQQLGVDLSSELAIWLTVQKQWSPLQDLLSGLPSLCTTCLTKDRVLDAQISLYLHQNNYKDAMTLITSHCFPTYGSDRARLIQHWYEAHLQMATAEKGSTLTRMDIVRLRRKIGCDGDSHTANYKSPCIRGPPNIGYAY